jgi:hypothetical protein
MVKTSEKDKIAKQINLMILKEFRKGSFRNLPKNATEIKRVELEISDPMVQVVPFGNEEEARRCYEEVMEDVLEFNSKLSSRIDFPIFPKPCFQFQYITGTQGAFLPKLDSLLEDNRIFMRPVAKIEKKYDYKGKIIFDTGESDAKGEFSHEDCTHCQRIYSISFPEGSPLVGFHRTPLVFSPDFPTEIDVVAGLQYLVLAHRLESATSIRIVKSLVSLNKIPTYEETRNFAENGNLEERIVSKAIIRRKLSKETDFRLEDVLKWNPDPSYDSKIDYNALAQVSRLGILGTIQFYLSKKWSLKEFLNG